MSRDSKPFAKKSLGQNFLVDDTVIDRIVAALDLNPDDTVIEIGPGRGALTEKLVFSGANVIAIELDRDLVPVLREQFSDFPKFHVVEADVLEVDLTDLSSNFKFEISNLKLAANLPYYISTAILQKLIEQRHLFSSMVLMFQKEVVDRITAPPGNSERGYLTVLVEAFMRVERLFDVPPGAFRPVPKVESSVIRLIPKGDTIADERRFRELLSLGFAQKRKTILNNLKVRFPDAAELLVLAGINSKLRPEALTLADWGRLATARIIA